MNDKVTDPSRRHLLKGSIAGAAATILGPVAAVHATKGTSGKTSGTDAIVLSNHPGKRPWLSPELWANRSQDWQLNHGRIECLRGNKGDEVRSVALLTRDIIAGQSSCNITITAGLLTPKGHQGFCGFRIGTGAGKLNYRAAALAQRGSGKGGGFLATFDTDGQIVFRDYSDEVDPLAFKPLTAEIKHRSSRPVSHDEQYRITLAITPEQQGFSVLMSVYDQHHQLFAQAKRSGVPEDQLLGGIGLLSSPPSHRAGARWWFTDITTGGAKISVDPARQVGPILGTLYSLTDNVMKLAAQLMPVGDTDNQQVTLEFRQAGTKGSWRQGQQTHLKPGYTALFKIPQWDSQRDWEYRIVYQTAGAKTDYYHGTIRKEPKKENDLVIGLYSCIMTTSRALAADPGKREMPQANFVGRYTPENFLHPHTELVNNSLAHDPDLVLFVGDQFYEHRPTKFEAGKDIYLDMLYRWYIWMWAFRDMTKDRPSLMLTDDHDVYHGNLWGNGGRLSPGGDQNKGGFNYSADFVNMVHRTQCSHNPDAFDPTPIDRNINVTYGAHTYGGISFALVEDRKFKTAPIQGQDLDVHAPEFLGERQEHFLRQWKDMHPGQPKICITQSVWASVQTSPEGEPLLDFDSNGYPPLARTRALELINDTGALMLSGDQHLATMVKHGLEGYDDGPVQFSGPAGASFWQRWFEPAQPLDNPTNIANSGNFRDAFGNKMRVLAVANPKVSFKEFREHIKGRWQGLDDRKLKTEGYGICRVDKSGQQFLLECWEWNEDPSQPGATQLPGWPYITPFKLS